MSILRHFSVRTVDFNTFKYHVFAPMGRFPLESIYLYCYSNERPTGHKHKYNSWDDGGK